jgi:hypothetical protein
MLCICFTANYSPDKLQQNNETLNLTQLDQSHVKKLAIQEDSCTQNLVHYPTPYAMTKISENEERVPLNVMSRSSPLKSVIDYTLQYSILFII